jgi:histidinol-phosphate/aromatic aminotransferase/cobyric acid decarboxylase-like protein
LLDFCYLVNPYFPTQKMQEEMKIYFHDLLSQYPSGLGVQNILAGKMFGIESENIIVGNGASELIKGLGKALNGTFGLVFPTFNEYPESIGHDRIVQYVSNNIDFSYTVDDLLCLAEKSDNLLLINPDNPSGHFIKKDELIKIADKLQKLNKMFILDESFVDFSTNSESDSLISQEILDKYQNLVVIKSISKSYGVPGIRLGILATSNKDVMSSISREVSIWNINSFGEFFLQIIGKYKNDYALGCSNIIQERSRFYKHLKGIPYLEVLPSEANYFLCFIKAKYSAIELSELLIDKYEIYIKDLTGKIGFEGHECVRIAVRDEVDNDKLIAALKSL